MSNPDGPNFSDIKNELNELCEPIIEKHLNGKIYNRKEAQGWLNSTIDDIIKLLQSKQFGFKFICTGIMFALDEGPSLNYSQTCLWTPNSDGSITIRWQNETLQILVQLFGVK